MRSGRLVRMGMAVLGVLLLGAVSYARVPYPVDSAYEDTVRICILWNVQNGVCKNIAPVGPQTRDFVVRALDTNYVKNVKILPAAEYENRDWPGVPTSFATTATIRNLWPGKLPHVIVHINAGWGIYNGPQLEAIFKWAVDRWIGVVEIGDDAAWMATSVFAMSYVHNLMPPLFTSQWLDKPEDRLWIILQAEKDVLVDSTAYPYLTGIVRNTVYKVLNGDSLIYFWPYDTSRSDSTRCEADPDGFTRIVDSLVTPLGYQQGWNATLEATDGIWSTMSATVDTGIQGGPEELTVIAAFHDQKKLSTGEEVMRRAVSLSLQPQFLQNETAMQQLVYDAVMYASLVKSLDIPDDDTVPPDTSHVRRQIIYSQSGGLKVSRAGLQALKLTMTVAQPIQSLRADIFGVNGKLIGSHTMAQPKAGKVEIAFPVRVSTGSLCLVRLRTQEQTGRESCSVTKMLVQ